MKLPRLVSTLAQLFFTFALAGFLAKGTLLQAAGAKVTLEHSVNLSFLTSEPREDAPVLQGGLTPAERNKALEFEMSLVMRNFEELQARIAAGEVLSQEVMEERYYPLASDYAAVEQWLTEQGFSVTERFAHRLGIFATGKISGIEKTFDTRFARVKAGGAVYNSAVLAPSVPEWLAGKLVGIHGLQPHHVAMKHSYAMASISHTTGTAPYFPQDIIAAYNAGTTTQTGAGETIAIVIDALPNSSDLTAFWTGCGVNQTINRVQNVALTTTLPAAQGEETLDAEWAGAIAPGANVRIYAAGSLADSNLNKAYARILQDSATVAGLHQVSLSYGADEIAYPASYLQSESQYFAALAGAGISVFASSGDTGNRGYYNPSQVTVSYPASDPYITSVGGTSLVLNTSAAVTSEKAWTSGGGGISTVFAKPSWQLTSYAKRTVPDLCTAADPYYGALVVLNSKLYQFGGTSWSAPVMAGFCARINQARTAAGLSPVGLLAGKIYALPTCFRDLTTGSNGYAASTGYDLCTGLGAPNVASLISALANPTSKGPIITTQPAAKTILAGQTASLSVTASSPTALTYQWYQGSTGDLTKPITAAKASTYTTPTLQDTTNYWVAVSNAGGTTNSATATVSVSKPPVISGQPQSLGVTVGAAAKFTVTATGTPAITSYQWQRLPVGTKTWVNVANSTVYSGATTATLGITATTTAMSGDQFRCLIANGISPNATTSSATLTVTVAPPVITGLAASLVSSSASGAVIKLSVTASGPAPFTYQWYTGASGDKTKPVANATQASYTTPALTKSANYWVAVTNGGGTVNSPTASITITMVK